MHARQVVLATNAFPSPLRRARAYVVPVWDHIIATEPLNQGQRESLGWAGCEGVCDFGNQFHYYRLTRDDRLVFGGDDALSSRPGQRAHPAGDGPAPAEALPPEPVRWLGIQLTRRSIARADANNGRRDLWLRLLDRMGLGFDS